MNLQSHGVGNSDLPAGDSATHRPFNGRSSALADPGVVRVIYDAVYWEVGKEPAGSEIPNKLRLFVRASARKVDELLADIALLDTMGRPAYRETLLLDPAETRGASQYFKLCSPLPLAGSLDSLVGALQYRLFCRMSGSLFTDGALYEPAIPVWFPSLQSESDSKEKANGKSGN